MFRIESHDPDPPPPPQRRPRQTDEQHLAFIRQLPCVICLSRPVDPAHLRAAKPLYGMRAIGAAEKPDDKRTTPLCRRHHDEQHAGNEYQFWVRHNLMNPWALALALYAASCDDDLQAAETIVALHNERMFFSGIS